MEVVDGSTAVTIVTEEAEKPLEMLAFDAFSRFLKSKFCEADRDELRTKSNTSNVRPFLR